MEQNFFYHFQDFLESLSNKVQILEDEVDIDVKMDYYKLSKQIRKAKEQYKLADLPSLDNDELSEKDKKKLLIKLSYLDDPKAYTILKNYTEVAPESLQQWAIMALQESRMVMEASFSDTSPVFISTGMGGKNGKLRYFVVMTSANLEEYSDFQKKIIKSEFIYELEKHNSELEEIEFSGKYAMLTVLIPFPVQFDMALQNALKECNQYGNFINDKLLITNVKKLTPQQLDELSEKSEEDNDEDDNFMPDDFDDFDELDDFDDLE